MRGKDGPDKMSGKFDFRGMEQLAKDLEKLAKNKDKLFQGAAKELAARLLSLVIDNTEPGDYPKGSGMVGGTLRRGWTSKTHEEAFSNRKNEPSAKDIQDFLSTIKISNEGNAYTIQVVDPVKYASYVESGHRTVNHKNWVKGKFMMRESVEDLQRIAPQMLEDKIERFLRECMG